MEAAFSEGTNAVFGEDFVESRVQDGKGEMGRLGEGWARMGPVRERRE